MTETQVERPYGLPAHGTRTRYRKNGCRCVACTRGPHGIDIPDKLTWPYKFLDRMARTQLEAWYQPEQINQWRHNGMGDFEADEVCVRLGFMPHEVFPGYMEAGLDCEVYP